MVGPTEVRAVRAANAAPRASSSSLMATRASSSHDSHVSPASSLLASREVLLSGPMPEKDTRGKLGNPAKAEKPALLRGLPDPALRALLYITRRVIIRTLSPG